MSYLQRLHRQKTSVLQGKGHGKIRLKTTYWPFTTIYSKPRKASKVSINWEISSIIP